MNRAPRLLAALTTSLLLALAACGNDDGVDVRNVGTESGGSGTGGSGSTAGSGSGAHDHDNAVVTACSPDGEDLESDATDTIEITLADYSFSPDAIEVEAGVVTFAAENAGTENHELAFLPDGDEVPLTAAGAPDEAALEAAGAFELEAFGRGRSCNATYELEAGEYLLFCIVEADDGETHYSKGMAGTLTVT